MSEETLFTPDPETENVVPNPEPTVNTLPPEVMELVGEGKKYKTTADALKALPHAQSHIQKIEEENARLKEEVLKAKAMEELLEEFKQHGNTNVDAAPQVQPKQGESVDIDSVVEAALARKEAQSIAKANAAKVVETFKATFGDESEAKFIALAQENGLSIQYLNNLAQTSPSAVLKLAGLTKEAPKSVPHSASSVNTASNFTSNQDVSAKVKLVGATSKEVAEAWRNAGIKAERLRNS